MDILCCPNPSQELVQTVLQGWEGVDKTSLKIVGDGYYLSCLDLLLHTCRAAGLFKRKLLLPASDQDVVLRMLLQAANKELTGDSTHPRSELLELQSRITRLRSEGKWPEKGKDNTVQLAAGNYQEFLKKCNLIDVWMVYEESRKLLRSGEPSRISLVYVQSIPESEKEVLNLLNLGTLRTISLVDKSLEISEPCNLETYDPELLSCEVGSSQLHPSSQIKPDTELSRDQLNSLLACPGVQSWIGILRLIVNTRDEISLARVLTQTGLLTPGQCQIVRQETEKSNLVMYQYIVSYITQASLGGKSYAPGEEHPFSEFELQLSELVKLMEKVQSKLEETTDPSSALEKVTQCVKSWLGKTGVKLEADICEVCESVDKCIQGRLESIESTPARGVMGKPALKLVTGLVDMFSCVSEKDEIPILTKTPSRSKKLVNFFRTPQMVKPGVSEPGVEQDGDEFDAFVNQGSIAERLNVKGETPTLLVQPEFPRFKSSLGWAGDSSPVPASVERVGVRVGGSTLVSSAFSPSTPVTTIENVSRILSDLKEKQEKELKENIEQGKKELAKTKTKSRKRILAREAEEIVQEKFGIQQEDKEERKEKKPKLENVEKKKKKTEKKKISTPKGQRKMTSFFTNK